MESDRVWGGAAQIFNILVRYVHAKRIQCFASREIETERNLAEYLGSSVKKDHKAEQRPQHGCMKEEATIKV